MSEPVSEPEQPDSEQPGADSPGGESPGNAKAGPESLTFRILPIALIAVFTIAVCVTPVAFTHPAGLALFLIPLGLGIWVLRAKTVVGPDKITVRMLRRTEIDWNDVRQIRLNERRWLRAVLSSGREVMLPAVRVRDLPRVAAMSGGRIPDPTANRADDTDQDETTAGDEPAGSEAGPPNDDESPTGEAGTPEGGSSAGDDSAGTSESDGARAEDGRDQH